jgi:hypothetical protein
VKSNRNNKVLLTYKAGDDVDDMEDYGDEIQIPVQTCYHSGNLRRYTFIIHLYVQLSYRSRQIFKEFGSKMLYKSF